MLSGTEWGELDYLLVDLPPGTGDVQLTLCQSYGLSAAIVVTTPQRLARVDVEKGIDMFRELGVPIAGLVENMAFFTDPRGDVHHPFGKTQLEGLRAYAGVDEADAVRLPIEEAVSVACDEGAPLVSSQPSSASATLLRRPERLTLSRAAPAARGGGGGAGDGVSAAAAAATGGGASLLFDPKRGIVLRVLSGREEGREYVLSTEAIWHLPGVPILTSGPHSSPMAAAAAAKRVPVVGLAMAHMAAGADDATRPAADGEVAAAVVIKWQGGGETRVLLEEFKRMCSGAA